MEFSNKWSARAFDLFLEALKKMSESKYSMDDLQSRSYRDLQQLAKSLGLPSNVKKIYLVQLIHAKKFKTSAEVLAIVEQVKLERLQSSQKKRRRVCQKINLQGTDVSSTSNLQSPPISNTPKRVVVLKYSPNTQKAINKCSRNSLLRSSVVKKKVLSPTKSIGSDRVLRSFNLRTQKETKDHRNRFWPTCQAQSLMKLTNSGDNTLERRMSIEKSIDLHKINEQQTNITSNFMLQKPSSCTKNTQTAPICRYERKQVVSVQNGENAVPARRERVPSGIYPLQREEPTSNTKYEYVKSIGFRRSDGQLSKIYAVVQKTKKNDQQHRPYKNIAMTMQDLINSNIDSQHIGVKKTTNTSQNNSPYIYSIASSCSQFPNIRTTADSTTNPKEVSGNVTNDRNNRNPSFGQSVRAEQVSSRKRMSHLRDLRLTDTLPKITQVFSRFKDYTQPLYIQVSGESERIPTNPVFISKTNNTNMLEYLCNFKNQFLVNRPFLQIASSAETKCVYSTPLITTALPQPSTNCGNEAFYVPSYKPPNQNYSDAGASRYDECKSDQDHTNDSIEDFSPSTSPADRSSQIVGSPATIPEMVEDALEIISQDGDYMERIGLESSVQCVLCEWAGTRDFLDQHIRKDHPNDIHKQVKSDFNMIFTLGSLVKQLLWSIKIIDHDSVLYVLSAKYKDPDYFMISLATVSPEFTPKLGSITVYNKVSGEPYTWTGEIEAMPPSLPYYTEKVCLKLEISSLNLLPDHANLTQLNKELVVKSLNEVIIDHPELNDIQIILFIKISN